MQEKKVTVHLRLDRGERLPSRAIMYWSSHQPAPGLDLFLSSFRGIPDEPIALKSISEATPRHDIQPAAGGGTPDHCSLFPNLFRNQLPNWRAHYPNPNSNLKPDNLCEELARTPQSSAGDRLAAETFTPRAPESWCLRLVSGWGLAIAFDVAGEMKADPDRSFPIVTAGVRQADLACRDGTIGVNLRNSIGDAGRAPVFLWVRCRTGFS